jgi:two-component system cell cycle sensor histidine kinase/response regulator CckA
VTQGKSTKRRSATRPAPARRAGRPTGIARSGEPGLPPVPARADELTAFRFAIEQAPDAVFLIDRTGRFPYVNEQACRSLGYSREELARLYLWEIDPTFPKERWDVEWAGYRKGELGMRQIETVHRRKDGVVFPIEVSSKHFRFDDGEFHVAFVRDITERKRGQEETARLEARLVQAQKMESVGRLAGGVAHEFNNMLSVILGNAELVRAALPGDDPLAGRVREIETAARRSRDITCQLLAFSRSQILTVRPIALNHVITEIRETLSRLIGEDVALRFRPGAELGWIRADPTQVEQILFNLAANARDAMPQGGQLAIETGTVFLDSDACRDRPEAQPGRYVCLLVQDDGAGMDSVVLARAFEPFFTTKEPGKGTGLGLATVYGIVKQSGGFVEVESRPGGGTTFRVFFPALDETGELPRESPAPPPSAAGALVLLLEDEPMVRETTTGMLEALGCSVLAVATLEEALAACARDGDRLDLLVSDVVMPGTSGPETARRIAALRPGLRTLFMSGHAADVMARHGVARESFHFIQKPFTIAELAAKVDEALGVR